MVLAFCFRSGDNHMIIIFTISLQLHNGAVQNRGRSVLLPRCMCTRYCYTLVLRNCFLFKRTPAYSQLKNKTEKNENWNNIITHARVQKKMITVNASRRGKYMHIIKMLYHIRVQRRVTCISVFFCRRRW